MKYEKQISKAIKKISKESGLSYGQIAIKLGVSKSGVNNWVWRNQMPIDSMLKVCEVFDTEITDFLKPNDEDVGKPCYKIYVIAERRRFPNSHYNYFCDTVSCLNYWKNHILNGGEAVLYVKERPFTKSDRLKLGKTVFWTKEEAEKAIGIIYEPQMERSEGE